MTNDDLNKFRGVVKEEINTALEPIKKTLDKHTEKIDALWEQTAKLSVDVVELSEDVAEIKGVLKSHIKKTDKRVARIENHLGLPVLPELTI